MTGAPQLAFDFDGPARRAALERMIAAGEQPGVVARTRLLEAWVAAHGHWAMYRRATAVLPWPAWHVGFTAPGGITSADVLEDMRDDGCVPTTLTADTRPDRHRPEEVPGREPYAVIWRGACLGCDFEGPVRENENGAVEDAHDHVYGEWWRDLPVIERPSSMASKKTVQRARERIVAQYEAAVPGSTTHPAGCPVRTQRLPRQTRHHAGGLLGGWDLGVDVSLRPEGMGR